MSTLHISVPTDRHIPLPEIQILILSAGMLIVSTSQPPIGSCIDWVVRMQICADARSAGGAVTFVPQDDPVCFFTTID